MLVFSVFVCVIFVHVFVFDVIVLPFIKQSLSAPVQLKGSVGCGHLGCCWGLTTPFFYPPQPPHPHSTNFSCYSTTMIKICQTLVQYSISYLFTLNIVVQHQSLNKVGGSTSPFQNQNIHGSPQFRLFVKCATPIRGG